MALTPGTRLGVYQITAQIGEGGMGEVYRATDTRLKRQVAIKILPPSVAADADRLARFQREAEVLASLNHPNIAAIHGLDESMGMTALVLELVEGEDLSQRITRGAIPIDEALPIARQIADALDAAHEKGIIHRDLKPANIKLTTDERVKVLDFGLAKAIDPLERDASAERYAPLSQSPTILASRLGVIVGTAAYMSPEQAKGKPVDKRADLWAFGCVLYEMLTGQRAFAGDDVADFIAAVLTREPDWSKLPPATPLRVVELLHHCLRKDPRERLRDIGDVRIDLADTRRANGDADASTSASANRSSWLLAAISVAGAIATAFVGGMWVQRRDTAPAQGSLVVERQLTANPSELPVYGAAISPDGRYLAYTDANGLFLRLIDTGETHGVSVPPRSRFGEVAWFPDSAHLLLTGASPSGETNSLYSLPVLGGQPSKLQDDAWRAAVSPDATAIAFLRARYPVHEVWLMGASGEQPRRLIAGGPAELFWQIGWSPDSRRVVYGVTRTDMRGSRAIESVDRAGGAASVLVNDGHLSQNWRGILPFSWLSDGRLLYARRDDAPNETGSNVWQVAVDAVGRPSGPAQRITEHVGFNVRDLTSSADGRRMTFLRERAQPDVYVAALQGSPPALRAVHRLTLDDRYDDTDGGGWTLDGAVLFRSNRGVSWEIFRQRPDAVLPDSVTADSIRDGNHPVESNLDKSGAAATPDGRWFVYRRRGAIMRVPTTGGPPEQITEASDGSEVRCGFVAGSRCVLGETGQESVDFSAFDPLRGKLAVLARAPRDTSGFVQWSLSMDGSRIALVDLADRIRVVGLDDGSTRTMQLQGWTATEFVSWSADGKGLFVQPMSLTGRRLAESTLLHVDLDGRVSRLLSSNNEWYIYPKASPDGRFLAFSTMRLESNAWMIER